MAVSFGGCVVALFVVMWVMTTNMTTNRSPLYCKGFADFWY